MNRANPQGKGLVPVLEAWRGAQPAMVEAKSPRRILTDYFTTLLVLSAEFAFKPRTGVTYHLYHARDRWQLSLIAPTEWGQRGPGPCLGSCELRADMTWRLALHDGIENQPALVEALQRFREGFINLMDKDNHLEDNLPYYVAELPYYRRLLAAGLASSLSRSLAMAGLTGTSGSRWLEGLPDHTRALVDDGQSPTSISRQ